MIELSIVIVEDDEILLNRLTKILSREISLVHSFSNPQKALEKILEIKPDIIISDIHMPGMSGLEMYKQLKNHDLDIPIILASAFSDPKYFIEAIKLKVKNFIVKPIDTQTLLNEIENFAEELKQKTDISKKEQLLLVQSKMAAMGEMLANIAHQWKQPLNTISLCATAIELEKETNRLKLDDLDKYMENIKNAVTYMSTTINDFQNYLEPNKLESCFYLKDTIKRIDNLISAQANSYNIQIIKNIDDSHLCNYQNELLQVLVNIIKNSIDELIKIDKTRYIFIDISTIENETIIEIKDNAGGIISEKIDKIFDAYYSTKDKSTSTGIGLYMSKQIVENSLEGEISAENVEYSYNEQNYKGAKFTLKLKSLPKSTKNF